MPPGGQLRQLQKNCDNYTTHLPTYYFMVALADDSGKGNGGASGRTIFVNGFVFGTDDNALTNHFGTVGAIEDHHFQSKGSAVITYVKAASAQRAVTELEGTTMTGQNRYVAVKLDTPLRKGSDTAGQEGKAASQTS